MKTLTDDENREVLATYAGFTKVDLPMYCHDKANDGDGWYVRPVTVRPYWSHGKVSYRELPDLLHSLDAQKTWVWPKFQDEGISISIILHEHKGASVTLTLTDEVHSDIAPVYLRGEDVAETCAEAMVKMIQRKKA